MSEALQNQFKALFEGDYPGIETLREKLIAPLWAGIDRPSLRVPVDEKDAGKIKAITIFANQNSDINFVDVELGVQ